jgi:hypothetical protein
MSADRPRKRIWTPKVPRRVLAAKDPMDSQADTQRIKPKWPRLSAAMDAIANGTSAIASVRRQGRRVAETIGARRSNPTSDFARGCNALEKQVDVDGILVAWVRGRWGEHAHGEPKERCRRWFGALRAHGCLWGGGLTLRTSRSAAAEGRVR